MSRIIPGFFKRHWIAIWLVVVIILSGVVTAVAVYANANNKIKRVIAPSSKSGSLFTSNYLTEEPNAIRSAYFNSEPYTFDVLIRNYHPTDPYRVFSKKIDYTFSAVLAHRNGTPYDAETDSALLSAMTEANQSVTIRCGSGDNEDTILLNGSNRSGSNSKDHSLSGRGETGVDRWTVEFSNIPLGTDICVRLTAEPTVGLELPILSATICIDDYPEARHEGWSCALNEDIPGAIIDNCDAFNYTITGTGSKEIKFSYDSTKLAINPACYLLITEIREPGTYSGSKDHGSDASNWVTVVITADPEITQINRYDLQVYKVNSFQPASFSEITPNAEGSYIEFE